MPAPSSPVRARLLAAALLALTSLGSGCFLWKQPAGTAERPTVLEFDIEGTDAVSAGEVRDLLVTQPSGRKYFIVPAPQYFDEDAFANDQRRVLRFYRARGYYKARIESAEVRREADDAGRARVVIRVTEGPPTRITRIETPGLDAAPEARDALSKLAVSIGDAFTEEAYDRGRLQILQVLTEHGWAKAEVRSSAQVDPILDEARITYEVVAGTRYSFGDVYVAGAAAIPRARIRREAEYGAKPGDTYDSRDVQKAQARVYDLGVFGGVRVTAGPPDEEKKTLPTVVQVRESPFRTIRAGPGLSFEASRWQADLQASWSHRNWLGGLRKLTLEGRFGYAWLPTPYNASQQGLVGLLSADFTQPELFSRYIDVNVHLEVERGRELAYKYFAERARIGLPLRLGGRTFGFTPSVNFELYQLGGQIGTPSGTGQQLSLSTCPGQNPNLCLLSYFEQRFSVDLRDDPINTTSGLYVSLALQEGFTMFGNGASYFRVLPEARAFWSPSPGFVLAGRLRLGVVQAAGGSELPLVALFTSGGPNFMRGYYTRNLSPVVLACRDVRFNSQTQQYECVSGESYVPVGGAGLIDGSLELRFPIAGKLGGAAFLDFGNVTYAARDALKLAELQYSVGLGVRYKTPFGPVRLDLAARLPRPDGDQSRVEILQITPVGGDRTRLVPTGRYHHEPIVSIHISIGEAF